MPMKKAGAHGHRLESVVELEGQPRLCAAAPCDAAPVTPASAPSGPALDPHGAAISPLCLLNEVALARGFGKRSRLRCNRHGRCGMGAECNPCCNEPCRD